MKRHLLWLTATPALALSLLSGLAPAQDAKLTWSGGLMGGNVQYDMSGPPGQLFALAPSLTVGPTPLAIFDPLDPRSLDVGLDLFTFIQFGTLTPTASIVLPIPTLPGLTGVALRAQFITIDPTGSTTT